MSLRDRSSRYHRSESHEVGAVSAFLAVAAPAVLALVGLVVDGGNALAARVTAMDVAEQAARAGAQQLSVDGLRADQVAVDPGTAVEVAEAFTVSAGHPGTASVNDGVVTVHVVIAQPTTILGIIGISHVTVSATAHAVDVHGVTRAD